MLHAHSKSSAWLHERTVILMITLALMVGCGNKTYRCPTSGMMPTMGPGDVFKAELRPYEQDSPQRNDIVVFRVPKDVFGDPDRKGVKRIVGLPGDEVAFREFRLLINGAVIDEQQINIPDDVQKFQGGGAPPYTDPITILNGYIFVAGDNRSNSLDSRYFGPLPLSAVEARAQIIIKSKEKERVGRRLDLHRTGLKR